MRKAAGLTLAAVGGAILPLSWPASLAATALAWRLWSRCALLAAAVQCALLATCFTAVVDSPAYEPTLPEGCRVIAARLIRPAPGRILVVNREGGARLVRYLAGPGSAVEMGKRSAVADGRAVSPLRRLPSRLRFRGEVPDGCIFVADFKAGADGLEPAPFVEAREAAGVAIAAVGPGWRFRWTP